MIVLLLSRRLGKCLLVLSFTLLVTGRAMRAEAGYAAAHGAVTDTSGAAITSAIVILENKVTGTAATRRTNQRGGYEFPQLSAGGPYTLTVSAAGFATFTSTGLMLGVDDNPRLDARLTGRGVDGPPVSRPDYAAPAAPEPAQLRGLIPPVQSSVEINGREQTLESGLEAPYHVTQEEVLASAGTWGDFARYLQLLPGVVWNSDWSNDILVRGGNPDENLYVVDGIEVPNINHFAVEGTTGGFAAMIDTGAIASVELKPGEYDASYSSRLSSLIEVRTRGEQPTEQEKELDFGIAGGGGLWERPLGKTGNLLLSAHRSVLNLFTNDIGINGVPTYANGLARLVWSPGSKDHISALSVDGGDEIHMTPEPCDIGDTEPFQTQYSGLRSTDGVVWQHTHNPTAISSLTVSYSAQNQDIGQQLQIPVDLNTHKCLSAWVTTPLYQENTHDGNSTAEYGFQIERRGWLVSMGAMGRLARMNYAVAQPLGQQSPYNPDPSWTDADHFRRNFASGQSAVYAEATGQFGSRWMVMGGARMETFALTGTHAIEPRASAAFRLNSHQAVNGSYGHSSQLAPTIDILSYAQNERLHPLNVEQFTAGAELWRGDNLTASVETYRKRYSNEPESTEYPSLMIANMVDMAGQQYVWLPLKTGGRGQAEGVELALRAHWAGHVQLLSSATYSKTRYAAADGVLRPGTYDFPLVGNGMATIHLPLRLEASVRDTYATGRPYTPFNIPLSLAQSRGIYDLTKVNAVRGPAYNRTDGDLNRSFQIGEARLNLYGGVENLFNRKNFLGIVWEDNCTPPLKKGRCGQNISALPGIPETEETQMTRFPSAGARFSF